MGPGYWRIEVYMYYVKGSPFRWQRWYLYWNGALDIGALEPIISKVAHSVGYTLAPTGYKTNFHSCNYFPLGWGLLKLISLTHWGRVTHICVYKLTTIGSDNDLSPGRRQAIIWTNAGILLIGPLGTNFSEFSIKILTFSFTKMRLKVSSAKWRPFCFGLNVLKWWYYIFCTSVPYILRITSIFGRCHRCWAVMTSDKYENDTSWVTHVWSFWKS